MNTKRKPSTKVDSNDKNTEWTDPDDAPEITAEMFASGVMKIGDKEVSEDEFRAAVKKCKSGRPVSDNPKQLVSIRYNANIIKYFKSTGKGWQSRINDVLLDYVKANK